MFIILLDFIRLVLNKSVISSPPFNNPKHFKFHVLFLLFYNRISIYCTFEVFCFFSYIQYYKYHYKVLKYAIDKCIHLITNMTTNQDENFYHILSLTITFT